jgi:hypothetical protein
MASKKIEKVSRRDYICSGPFCYGSANRVCVHGWNIGHTLSEEEAQKTDHLTNCGLLPERQRIEKIED